MRSELTDPTTARLSLGDVLAAIVIEGGAFKVHSFSASELWRYGGPPAATEALMGDLAALAAGWDELGIDADAFVTCAVCHCVFHFAALDGDRVCVCPGEGDTVRYVGRTVTNVEPNAEGEVVKSDPDGRRHFVDWGWTTCNGTWHTTAELQLVRRADC